MQLRPAALDVLEQVEEVAQVEVWHEPRLHADLGRTAPYRVLDLDEDGLPVVPVSGVVAGIAAETAEEAGADAGVGDIDIAVDDIGDNIADELLAE